MSAQKKDRFKNMKYAAEKEKENYAETSIKMKNLRDTANRFESRGSPQLLQKLHSRTSRNRQWHFRGSTQLRSRM